MILDNKWFNNFLKIWKAVNFLFDYSHQTSDKRKNFSNSNKSLELFERERVRPRSDSQFR